MKSTNYSIPIATYIARYSSPEQIRIYLLIAQSTEIKAGLISFSSLLGSITIFYLLFGGNSYFENVVNANLANFPLTDAKIGLFGIALFFLVLFFAFIGKFLIARSQVKVLTESLDILRP